MKKKSGNPYWRRKLISLEPDTGRKLQKNKKTVRMKIEGQTIAQGELINLEIDAQSEMKKSKKNAMITYEENTEFSDWERYCGGSRKTKWKDGYIEKID